MNTSDEAIRARIERMWESGWKQRLTSFVASKGYSTITEFLNSVPCKPYGDIVADFGNEFAPIQVATCQFDEAKRTGEVLHAVKDSLCRYISQQFPNGWGVGENVEYRRASALASWSTEVEVTGQVAGFSPIFSCFVGSFSPSKGWRPSGPEDHVVSTLLNECWTKFKSTK